jgi:NADH:ubiquinone oxidoreductase subunit 2 (subunit N)
MTSHLALMALYSLLCALFFSHYWRRGAQEVRRMFLKILAYMMLGGIVTAWVLYPLPL